MLVSVVIPCHRGVQDTRACIESLLAQALQGSSLALEILVVDNASGDETAHLDCEYPQVRVLGQTANLGFAGGVNKGLAAAEGSYLMVLNNDTLAAPHLLVRLLRPLLQDDRIGITAPVSNYVKGEARLEVAGEVGLVAESRVALEGALCEFAGGKIQDVDSLSGLCMMFSREAWQRVGPFDERFVPGNFEDDDFSLRARLLGYRLVIVRDAFLHHHGHRTFRALGMDYRAALLEQQTLFRDKWRRDPAGRTLLCLLDGNLEAAAQAAFLGLASHPAWPDGDLVLAQWHAQANRHHEAIHHLRRFVSRCPRHTTAQVMLAFQLLLCGDEAAGNARLAQAAADCYFSDRAAAEVLSLRGRWLLRQQRPAAAAELLQAALDFDPGNTDLHSVLAVCQQHLERRTGASAIGNC